MTQPKPIITIKQKCNNCKKRGYTTTHCYGCEGTGQQTIEIYNLKDFEKCDCQIPVSKTRKEELQTKCINCGIKFDLVSAIFTPICNRCRLERYSKCKHIGYKIPFKDYEIKKISEITEEFKGLYSSEKITAEDCSNWFEVKENIKEDDKIVMVIK